ncbi:WYL domain-containing protein [Idiomarina sp.]|uniref:WYL domain-containing protein n=1 Tax=Idiomarina sp. TaxID=1874361 RepID=UPI003A936186
MEIFTSVLAWLVFGCAWSFVVRSMRAKGKGVVVRHMAGFVVGFVVCSILLTMMVSEGWVPVTIGIIISVVLVLARWAAYAHDNMTPEERAEMNEKQKKHAAEKADGSKQEGPAEKPSNELIILAKFILEDDKVEQKEAEQLLELLNCTPPYLMDPVTRTLFQATDHALSDGVLDKAEADEIRVLLGEVCDLELERKVMPEPAKPKYKPKKPANKKEKSFNPKPSRGVSELHSGDVYELTYFDANFNVSIRKVDFRSARGSNGRQYMDAYCHERRALRTFRGDRIESMVNCKTGEVIESVEKSLAAFNRH